MRRTSRYRRHDEVVQMKALGHIVILACVFSGHQEAGAHARSESYSNWHIAGDTATGVITVSAGDIMTLVELGNAQRLDNLFAAHLAETVTFSAESGDCPSPGPTVLQAARGFVRVEMRFHCNGEAPAMLRYRALLDQLPAHVHFARIYDNDVFVAETLLTDHADSWSNDATEPLTHSFAAFLELGIRHILGGADHIAFLFGMLLLAGTPGRSVAAVTGFTLGHSISLAAAVFGYVHADGRLVEAFIGFTVAMVAVEYFLLRGPSPAALAAIAALSAWAIGAVAVFGNFLPVKAIFAYLGFGVFAFCYLVASSRVPAHRNRLASVVLIAATSCFGLIHGFGFAGFLMGSGISGDSLLLPLLGFNVGVEIGQFALLTLAFLVVYFFRDSQGRLLAPMAAASVCGIGVFWFISRSFAAY